MIKFYVEGKSFVSFSVNSFFKNSFLTSSCSMLVHDAHDAHDADADADVGDARPMIRTKKDKRKIESNLK